MLKAPLLGQGGSPINECAEAKDSDPIRAETMWERRLRSLEESLKSLAHIVIHDYVYWRCESCGASNRTLRYLGQAMHFWACDSCGDQQREDYRKFLVNRRP